MVRDGCIKSVAFGVMILIVLRPYVAQTQTLDGRILVRQLRLRRQAW